MEHKYTICPFKSWVLLHSKTFNKQKSINEYVKACRMGTLLCRQPV